MSISNTLRTLDHNLPLTAHREIIRRSWLFPTVWHLLFSEEERGNAALHLSNFYKYCIAHNIDINTTWADILDSKLSSQVSKLGFIKYFIDNHNVLFQALCYLAYGDNEIERSLLDEQLVKESSLYADSYIKEHYNKLLSN